MISYVVAENPDDRVLEKASQLLKSGRLLCLPTESNWIVLADPFVKEGVDRLYRFRHVDNTKHFTLFCSDISQVSDIAMVSDFNFRFLKKYTPGSFTFILKAQKKITRHLKASKTDHQVGVRICPSPLLRALLTRHAGPAIGSHVDASMIPDHSEELSIWAGLIEDTYGHSIDLIMDTGEVEFQGQTTIIDLSGEEGPEVIREGIGLLD